MATDARKRATGLAVLVLIYGAIILFVYLVGWISPRMCEGLSSIPCFTVAGWYVWMVGSQRGMILHRWGWTLFAFGWFLVGLAFLLPSGVGRLVSLSSAAPTLLVGFGTTFLARWFDHGEGGTDR